MPNHFKALISAALFIPTANELKVFLNKFSLGGIPELEEQLEVLMKKEQAEIEAFWGESSITDSQLQTVQLSGLQANTDSTQLGQNLGDNASPTWGDWGATDSQLQAIQLSGLQADADATQRSQNLGTNLSPLWEDCEVTDNQLQAVQLSGLQANTESIQVSQNLNNKASSNWDDCGVTDSQLQTVQLDSTQQSLNTSVREECIWGGNFSDSQPIQLGQKINSTIASDNDEHNVSDTLQKEVSRSMQNGSILNTTPILSPSHTFKPILSSSHNFNPLIIDGPSTSQYQSMFLNHTNIDDLPSPFSSTPNPRDPKVSHVVGLWGGIVEQLDKLEGEQGVNAMDNVYQSVIYELDDLQSDARSNDVEFLSQNLDNIVQQLQNLNAQAEQCAENKCLLNMLDQKQPEGSACTTSNLPLSKEKLDEELLVIVRKVVSLSSTRVGRSSTTLLQTGKKKGGYGQKGRGKWTKNVDWERSGELQESVRVEETPTTTRSSAEEVLPPTAPAEPATLNKGRKRKSDSNKDGDSKKKKKNERKSKLVKGNKKGGKVGESSQKKKRSSRAKKSCEKDGENNLYRQVNEQVSREERLEGKARVCNLCAHKPSFASGRELYYHRVFTHRNEQVGGEMVLQDYPWEGPENAPWGFGDHKNEGLEKEYEAHKTAILQQDRVGGIQSRYNLPVNQHFEIDQLEDKLRQIFRNQPVSFKVNITFGSILQNKETENYRYFRPGTDTLFDFPQAVTDAEDLERFIEALKSKNIRDIIEISREDTKSRFIVLTHIIITIDSMAYPLGYSGVKLPDYLLNCRSVITLTSDAKGRPFKDRLCLFRALALHGNCAIRKKITALQDKTLENFGKWRTYQRLRGADASPHKFPGVMFEEFPEIEECFETNINIFHLNEDLVANSLYRTAGRYGKTVNLNLYQNHLAYITKPNAFAQKFKCPICYKLFKRKDNCDRHLKICEKKTQFIFPGGYYRPGKTVFDELEEVGISTKTEERLFHHFAVFDFEALLQQLPQNQDSPATTWTHQHIPISVSVCSNVETFKKPRCFITPDTDELLKQMMDYLEEIVDHNTRYYMEKWSHVFQKLQDMIEIWTDGVTEDGDLVSSYNPQEANEGYPGMAKKLEKISESLRKYCCQLPVLGFNSARYDLNLIKTKIAIHLKMHLSKESFVVKRGNSYACLANDKFKFLDITSYLSPGTSYVAFLKAFDVEEQKSYFPYEWFKDASQLEERSLPPLGPAWYSNLKRKSVLDDGGLSVEENYAGLQKVWDENRMTTFRDFLEFYNNMDTGPFVTAVTRLQEFYFSKGVDVFKVAISAPGIARSMIFESAAKVGAQFALMDQKNKDLFFTMKQNLTGGPSIIFNRKHLVGQTFLRNNTNKPCGRIIGFDANALYLHSFNQLMPVGGYIRRHHQDSFVPKKSDQYDKMFYWMTWLNTNEERNILHARNNGGEVRIGPYPVDGYEAETNCVFQFQGCYFHGHRCHLTKHIKDSKTCKLLDKRRENTEKTNTFLRGKGFQVVEMYECEFDKQINSTPLLKLHVQDSRPPFTKKHPNKINNPDILIKAIQDESLFGMVEVDIEVPTKWDAGFINKPNCSPYKYFQEMSPIFATTEVEFRDIGPHMQSHIRKKKLSEKPRKLLVGGMRGRQMLFATPLLKWYLDHGLKITKIYQVIEFKSSACFRDFVDSVSEARRLGDVDETKATIGDTMKLIGNSAYGSMIMDKTRHTSVKYVSGYASLAKVVNNPKYKRMSEISDGYFETECAKSRIKMDLPTQIGFFVLNYAKLRMLEFYYDFVDKYLGRSNFEYCEMDTDSAYMAITQKDFKSCIKPGMLADYERGLSSFCTDERVEADNEFHWFPRTCCTKHAKHDKRTPGLFKIEFEGDEIVGLCSKTYAVKNDEECKFSSKGVNKRFIDEPMERYNKVLKTHEAGKSVNVGFRVYNHAVRTYTQEKTGFSYLYCKRVVHEDGRTTSPLNITLCPLPLSQNDQSQSDSEKV